MALSRLVVNFPVIYVFDVLILFPDHPLGSLMHTGLSDFAIDDIFGLHRFSKARHKYWK